MCFPPPSALLTLTLNPDLTFCSYAGPLVCFPPPSVVLAGNRLAAVLKLVRSCMPGPHPWMEPVQGAKCRWVWGWRGGAKGEGEDCEFFMMEKVLEIRCMERRLFLLLCGGCVCFSPKK